MKMTDKTADKAVDKTKTKKVKVLVVDDHTLVRETMIQTINNEKDLMVVASTGDGSEVASLIKKNDPDVVLMDIELPSGSGLTLAQDLYEKFPKLQIVFVTMHRHEEYALRALRIGAQGYVLKTSTSAELVDALRSVAAGTTYIAREVSDRIARNVARNGGNQAYSQLSDREFQVLRGLATGLSCGELAKKFDLSVKTIYTYRTRLLEKLDVKNDIDLLRYVLRNNLLVGEDVPLELQSGQSAAAKE